MEFLNDEFLSLKNYFLVMGFKKLFILNKYSQII